MEIGIDAFHVTESHLLSQHHLVHGTDEED